MPRLLGNDNRTTVTWLPKAQVAPSAGWQSTYYDHYRSPAKRLTRNHEYWLKKGAERAAAQQAAMEAGLFIEGKGQATFRDPTLAAAYNAQHPALRNPSSLPRSSSAASQGLLQSRGLHPSLRATSQRSFDSFEASRSQRFYAQKPDVSALRVLEGVAAGESPQVPIVATMRPESQARPQTAQPRMLNMAATVRSPQQRFEQYRYTTRVRPATAAAQRQRQPRYDVLDADYAASTPSLAAFSPTAAWGNEEPLKSSADLSGSCAFANGRSGAGFYRNVSPTGLDPVQRSLTFRPQLTSSHSSPNISANVLLNLTAAQDREARRAAEYQGERVGVLQL